MSVPRRRLLRAAQVALGATLAWLIASTLWRQWGEVRRAAEHASLRWGYVAASCAVVLLTYALLLEAWRLAANGWGPRLRYREAARIWFVSSLGRYLPGKLWQLGAMAAMARRKGVPGIAAAGSMLLVTLINTVTGSVVVAATGARGLDIPPIGAAVLAALGGAIVLTPAVLPLLGAVAARVTGREVTIPALPGYAIPFAAGFTALAWVSYGVAFHLLSIGVLGKPPGALSLSIAVFTGSYLVGFLALFAPAGIFVREAVMYTALTVAGLAAGPAVLLIVASRLWLTVLEVVPPLLFLVRRERTVHVDVQ